MNSSPVKNWPLVSVVISTYNRANSVLKAIQSVRQQNYPNIEIIIVNDGSTDTTKEVLERESDIVLINNLTNLRLQKSLNIGCKTAKGKYIARLDDHDEWIDREKLRKQVEVLEKDAKVALIGTAAQQGKRIISNPLTDQSIRKQILFRSPFCHITIVMRKEAFLAVGGYDESLAYSEDWDLWLKLGQKYHFANLPDNTTMISEEAGFTQAFYVSQSEINKKIIHQFKDIYPGHLRALLYHWFVRQFFRLFPVNGPTHRFFTGIYDYFFLRMQ